MSARYRYEYKLTKRLGHWFHSYLVVGRWGAVSLHITDYGEGRLESYRKALAEETGRQEASHA